MRRCLHAFLIALLTIALSMDAARACWFLRARRQCRPCPPPAWSGCGEVVVVRGPAVGAGCCQPLTCQPAAACCEGSEFMGEESAAVSEGVVDRDAESPPRSVVRDQPAEASGGGVSAAPTEPPAPRTDLVQPASNNEPLPDLEPVETTVTATGPVDEPAAPPAEPEPDPRAGDLPDEAFREDEAAAAGPPLPPAAETPAAEPIEESRELADGLADEAEELADEAEEMAAESDESIDQPAEPADEAADQMPDDEPPSRRPLPPLPGIEDEPPLAEEAAETEPESDPNLFEEFDEGSAPESEFEEEMAAEEAGRFADEEEPVRTAEPVIDESADLPFGDDPVTADEDPPMADDEAEPVADEDADAVPGAAGDDDEPLPAAAEDGDPAEPAGPPDEPDDEPLPADESDPFAEADDSESLAVAEPLRRWIHASGAYSLVARLRDSAGDGSCLLEADGRLIRVPLENLSGHDRDYVRDSGVRLAALRDARERAAAATATTAPQATDTAGL